MIKSLISKVSQKTGHTKIKRYAHLSKAVLANIQNDFPAKKLKCIGVTGTNGKTTTTNIIFTMMKEAGYKVAVSSSTQYGYMDNLHDEDTHMSTVPAPILQKRLRQFVDQGAEWLVIEVTSHALAQSRIWGLDFEVVVMTNITHEHLDYHGTFERYVEDKRKLFKMASKNKSSLGIAYAEDPSAKKFMSTTHRSVSYGINKGDLRAKSINLGTYKSTFTAENKNKKYHITINIPGEFNVLNALAAICVGEELGMSIKQIEKGVEALKGVPGRMTFINEGQPFRAIVDYAGTPDAFEKVFSSIRPDTKGKLVCVYGSPAKRDKLKRPIQGEISGRYCDEIILTEEENRDEPGMQILEDIAVGVEKTGKIRGKNLFLIEDRKKAIEFAMTRVKNKDDVVITLGKSHEKTIERGDKVIQWNEQEVVRQSIKKVQKNNPKK